MLSGPAYGRVGYVTNCCLWVVSRSTVCPFQVEVFNCWCETLQGWISPWQGGNIWGGGYSIILGSWVNSSCKTEIGWVIIVVVQPFSVSDSLRPRGLQHSRLPCPSPTLRACSNSCPSSWWCHPTISFSVTPFSSCLQSFPASGSFPVSQFFASGGQSIGVSASASVLPMSIQGWFPLGLTGLISLLSSDDK